MIYQTRTARGGFSLMVEQVGELGYLVSPAVDGLAVAGAYTAWCSTRAEAISTAELLMATYETHLGKWVNRPWYEFLRFTWDVEMPLWMSPVYVDEEEGGTWRTMVIKDLAVQIPGKIGYLVLIVHNGMRLPVCSMLSLNKAINKALKLWGDLGARWDGSQEHIFR